MMLKSIMFQILKAIKIKMEQEQKEKSNFRLF